MAYGYPTPRCNYRATTAPTVTDDIGNRYEVGSIWVDTVAEVIYTCVSNARGAAVWVSGGGGGGVPTPACIWPILTADATMTPVWGLLTFDSSGNIVVDSSGYPVLGAC